MPMPDADIAAASSASRGASVVADRSRLPGVHPQLRRRRRRRSWRPRRPSRPLGPHRQRSGVDAIWINPWYPSPMHDAGYDVADYRAIEPAFGTPGRCRGADRRGARSAGSRCMLDIVPNHTSSEHAGSRPRCDGDQAARARYIFRPGRGQSGDEPPNDWQSIFGGPAWTRTKDADGRPGDWYLHLFAPEQPDLDWTNPEVAAEFEDILRFWFDRDVDGFRIDVAHGLVKAAGLPDAGGISNLAAPARSRIQPGTRTACMRSTARGARSRTPTSRHESSSPRRGWPTTSGWPDTCGRTSCTPPSSSTSCARPGVPITFAESSTMQWPPPEAVGAASTWVLSNHDVVRHVTAMRARSQIIWSKATGSGSAGDEPADLGAGYPSGPRSRDCWCWPFPASPTSTKVTSSGLEEVEDLPGEIRQDPDLVAVRLHRPRPRRLPRAAAVVGSAPPFGFSPDDASADAMAAATRHWAELTCRTTRPRSRVDAQPVPQRVAAAARASAR